VSTQLLGKRPKLLIELPGRLIRFGKGLQCRRKTIQLAKQLAVLAQ